jgi:F-type H+-transporting ATPase subunit epsilon
MRLKVLLPSNVLVDEEVTKVIAEGEDGSFCLLPRHIDFVAALSAGLLSFVSNHGGEEFLAIDEAVLVKCGAEVLVSAKDGVRGPDLGELTQTVEKVFKRLDEREEKSRIALAKLEASLIRRFVELEH